MIETNNFALGWRLWSGLHFPSDFECDVIERVLGLTLKDKVILEVGCGDGRVTRRLAERCHNAVGIDTNQTLIDFLHSQAEAPASGNLTYLQMNACNLVFDDHFFDIVVFPWSFHQIKDKVKALQEARRVLKKDGALVIFGLLAGGDYDKIILKLNLDPGPLAESLPDYEEPLNRVFGRLEAIRAIGTGDRDLRFGFKFASMKNALAAWQWALINWHEHKAQRGDEEWLMEELRQFQSSDGIYMNVIGNLYLAFKSDSAS